MLQRCGDGPGGGGGFHGYDYFQQDFGLYDEDEQIETLQGQEFADMVSGRFGAPRAIQPGTDSGG